LTHLGERGIKLGLFDVENAGSNNVSADSTGASKFGLLGDVNVGNVLINKVRDKRSWRTYLVFAEKGEMEDDLEGFGVGGEDDKAGHSTVKGFRCFVSSFLQLYHVQIPVSINSIIRQKQNI